MRSRCRRATSSSERDLSTPQQRAYLCVAPFEPNQPTITMNIIGKVDSLWRYPVKSMRGEALREAFLGFAGMHGDRVFAFRSSASPKGFPYLTAREQRKLLSCQPPFRHPARSVR